MTASPQNSHQDMKKKNNRLRISTRICRLVGRAIYRYDMITPGDRIAVGVSGGKDSLMLLYLMKYINTYSPVKYDLQAISVDMTNGEWDTTPLRKICDELKVPLTIVPYAIEYIIEAKGEKSPCALCANLRRGILNTTAQRLGCNKIALGHNFDDVVETALMNLLRNGRFRSFQPKLWHDRVDIWLIRPMIYLTERQILNEVDRLGIKTCQHCCKFGADTERSRTKTLIAELSPRFPDIKRSILHALENHHEGDQWTPTPRRYTGVYFYPYPDKPRPENAEVQTNPSAEPDGENEKEDQKS